jgi:hypothetical protein
LLTALSLPAFAGNTYDHSKAQTETKSSKSQSIESQYPESIRSQVLLGGLSDSHKKFLLEKQRKKNLYN